MDGKEEGGEEAYHLRGVWFGDGDNKYGLGLERGLERW